MHNSSQVKDPQSMEPPKWHKETHFIEGQRARMTETDWLWTRIDFRSKCGRNTCSSVTSRVVFAIIYSQNQHYCSIEWTRVKWCEWLCGVFDLFINFKNSTPASAVVRVNSDLLLLLLYWNCMQLETGLTGWFREDLQDECMLHCDVGQLAVPDHNGY